MSMICPLMNCWKKMDRFLRVTTIFRLLQQRCLRSLTIYLKLFLGIYFLGKRIHTIFVEIEFQLPRVNTVWNGPNSYRCFRAIIWDLLPSVLECTSSLEKFKIGVRKWKPKRCTCRICKTFIPNIGFSNIYQCK